MSLQEKGKSLSDDDRVASAKRLYSFGDQSQASIAESLGVSRTTVTGWLSRTLKEEKEQKQDKAFDLWLACATQQEIAEAVGVDQKTITNWEDGFRKLSAADNFLNFDPPIYNIWKQQTKTDGATPIDGPTQQTSEGKDS